MVTQGADIGDVLRRLGKDAVVRELENAGLHPARNRSRCPFQGCVDKADKKDTVQLYPGKRGEWRLRCHRCGTDGSLVDLLAALRKWTDAQAIAHLHGVEMPAAPPLRLVQAPSPDADKLDAKAVQSVWDGLTPQDMAGQAYLEERSLGDAVKLGLVRFAHAGHPDKTVRLWASRGRLVVCLLRDVTGNPRGLQARLVRPPEGKEPKISSLKGSVTGRAFFGRPDLVESSPVVVVAEGLADTLAAAGWAGDSACVVGAAGKDALPRLAEELERCDISVDGRIFVLLPQNDRPENKSRRSFEQLAQLLHRRGARVVFASTPDEYKDVALWLHEHPDTAWPPPSLAAVLGGDVEDMEPAAAAAVRVEAALGALPIPSRHTVEAFGQNLSTLMALLDDGVHREALMGLRGDFSVNEMTEGIDYAGRELSDNDVTGLRVRLEGFTTPEGKRLKYAEADVRAALSYLAGRRRIHPVRQWLEGLVWDGKPRLDTELCRALGHAEGSFEAMLLRRWFLSAVARVMSPGCKVDTMLVLIGRQGAGKSTFFSVLGGAWHTDSKVDVGDKDGLLVMRKAWIVEWAELDSMRRARDQEALKAFLSSRVDCFRAPYARSVTESPRHCVVVGTTNGREFLGDASGSRRYWPVSASVVDIDWVRAAREQLFAEALHRFRAGEPWWLSNEEAVQLAQHNREYEMQDSWTDIVNDWLADNRHLRDVTVAQLLVLAVGKKAQDCTRTDEMRVAAILRQADWEGPFRQRLGPVVRRVYRRPFEPLE